MNNKARQVINLTPLEEYSLQIQDNIMENDAIKDVEELKRRKVSLKASLWELDTAKKYKFTQSAISMVNRLKPDYCTSMHDLLPGTGIWIQFDDEEETSIYFCCFMHAVSSYAEHNDYSMLEKMKDSPLLNSGNAYWTMDVWTKRKEQYGFMRYGYDEVDDRWNLPGEYQCPFGLCEILYKPPLNISALPYWYMCEECKKKFEYWTAWLPTALMAINGDFAETEEQQARKTYIEREKRKIQKGKGYIDRPVLHNFEVVTFDMSIKYASSEESTDSEPNKPTWLDRAIEDNAVLYVSKRIGETQRTFRSERYVNMRGKTITVKSFEKRIPMKIDRLKRAIYKAIASKEQAIK